MYNVAVIAHTYDNCSYVLLITQRHFCLRKWIEIRKNSLDLLGIKKIEFRMLPSN